MSQLKYHSQYIESRNRIIENTRIKRTDYREILNNHLQVIYGYKLLQPSDINSLSGVNFLLSSSRGGSSITVDILKQQAQSVSSVGKRILFLPGEQRPYFELAKLTPPFKKILSDRLDKSFINKEQVGYFLSELTSEIGYPVSQTTDLKGFAIAIYGRLLLQWPNINFGDPDNAIRTIELAIEKVSCVIDNTLIYKDEVVSREKLMNYIKLYFSKIDLRFYDSINSKIDTSSTVSFSQYGFFIEEPPFIIPSPWHFASINDLSTGILILKDPSDAWRIPFWKWIFNRIPLSYTHLTRNVYESINGLCEGWNFPYGYITTRSPQPIQIKGYTSIELPWTSWYVNYSTSDKVWKLLLSHQEVYLEKIVVQQWIDAHQSIINQVGNDLNYFRLSSNKYEDKIGFEWLRSEPIEAISQLCNIFEFELTSTLLKAAQQIAIHQVQVTPGTNGESNRWEKAPNRNMIALYANDPVVVDLSKKLGYSTK